MKALFLLLTLFLSSLCQSAEQKQPNDPSMKWKPSPVLDCIVKGTGNLKLKFIRLNESIAKAKIARISFSEHIIAQRRLQEQWCLVEVRCLSDFTKSNEDDLIIASEQFSSCLSQLVEQ